MVPGLAATQRRQAMAFTAAPNPKLLAVDLLLIQNRRTRAMFLACCTAA